MKKHLLCLLTLLILVLAKTSPSLADNADNELSNTLNCSALFLSIGLAAKEKDGETEKAIMLFKGADVLREHAYLIAEKQDIPDHKEYVHSKLNENIKGWLEKDIEAKRNKNLDYLENKKEKITFCADLGESITPSTK